MDGWMDGWMDGFINFSYNPMTSNSIYFTIISINVKFIKNRFFK
jgi:hypothetical protein